MKLDEIVKDVWESYDSFGHLLLRAGFDYKFDLVLGEGDYARDFSPDEASEISFILREYFCNSRKAVYGTDERPYKALNAEELKHIPARITVHLKEEDKVYILSVTDNGDGIPPENKDKIFRDKFSTRGTTGMGLKLVCDKAIYELRGYVDFESEVGKGSTFRLYLPKQNEQ